ncbi:MAG: DNA-3-methyladenine glycosylase I [Gammaproteobacteria bacterium]
MPASKPQPAVPLARCPWVDLGKPDYVAYHDQEWGVPVTDDRSLFELLVLEGAQAGLSWYTVLRKRPHYRAAFAGFDIHRVAGFTAADAARLCEDAGIVRNRLKIESAIGNARALLEVAAEHGSFAAYLWSFVDGQPIVNAPRTLADYVATSTQSDALSRDLKKRGFRFVGSTIVYAFMQAAGLVNDHAGDCYRQAVVARMPGWSGHRK